MALSATDADREWHGLSRRPSPGFRPPSPGGRGKENSRIPAQNEAKLAAPNEANRDAKRSQSRRETKPIRRAERSHSRRETKPNYVAPNEAVFERKPWKRSRYAALKEGLAAGRRVFEDFTCTSRRADFTMEWKKRLCNPPERLRKDWCCHHPAPQHTSVGVNHDTKQSRGDRTESRTSGDSSRPRSEE